MSGTALLALHYQNEVLHREGKIALGIARDAGGRDQLVRSAVRLLAGARTVGMPIVHVRIAFPAGHLGVAVNAPIFCNVVAVKAMEEGSWGAEFHEGLEPEASEAVVTHARVNAFFESSLEARLHALGATRLVMAGVATNSVVEHSARHAADMGYEVVVAADACSAADPAVHDAALFNIRLVGGVSTVAALFPGVTR